MLNEIASVTNFEFQWLKRLTRMSVIEPEIAVINATAKR